MSRLWYTSPAKEWEEALPLGNGRLGAMVYGGTDHEHIQVNEESVWYGGPVERNNPDMKEQLPRIRKLLFDGEIARAEQLMRHAMSGCPNSQHPYQTLGDIQIGFDGIGVTSAYERELDLEQALCKTSFTAGEVRYQREYFISHPADCMVMRFTADKSGKISFWAGLERWYFFDGVKQGGQGEICLYGNLGRGGTEFAMMLQARVKGGSVSLLGEHIIVEGADEAELYFSADTSWHYSPEEKDAAVDSWLKQVTGEPENWMNAGRMSSHERQEMRVQQGLQELLRTNLRRRLDQARAQSYESLRDAHVADYRELFGRTSLEIEWDHRAEQLPTDKRVELASRGLAAGRAEQTADESEAERVERTDDESTARRVEQADDQSAAECAEQTAHGSAVRPAPDLGLAPLYFDFGRYLLIACSRPGGLPATLQGLWNKDFTPPWGGKFTININTEMNYWLAENCNLSQCHMPLFDLIRIMVPNGRRTAREMYGCRGFVCHHNTDINGDTAPQDLWIPGTYWVMGAAWLCTHQWTHYQYTQDLEFLKEQFPIMCEAALFFLDFLVEDGPYLVTCPSVSPENTYILPGGERGANGIGVTMDNQILRDLFGQCLAAYQVLVERDGCDGAVKAALEEAEIPDLPAFIRQVEETRARLIPTQISDRGTILEWRQDYEEKEPGHRHISHLYGLHPSEQITMDDTPELARAARATLERRLAHGGGHTGWSRAWIINHYAKLWDGNTAYRNIEQLLGKSTYPNLFDRHPPFQIDGNFGGAAAMAEMLVQSNSKRVVLLPALPDAWRSGSVRGLRIQGNAEIDLFWRDGVLERCRVRADSELDTRVRYGESVLPLRAAAGESVTFTAADFKK